VAHLDETSGRPGGQRAWLWVAVTRWVTRGAGAPWATVRPTAHDPAHRVRSTVVWGPPSTSRSAEVRQLRESVQRLPVTSSFTDFTPSFTPLTSLSIPCARSSPSCANRSIVMFFCGSIDSALPDSINLSMPAECVNKAPHGICARECVSPLQVRLLRAQRMWGSAKPLCEDQQNP
jgi:hypothetical protein